MSSSWSRVRGRAGTFRGRDAVGRWVGEWISSFDEGFHAVAKAEGIETVRLRRRAT